MLRSTIFLVSIVQQYCCTNFLFSYFSFLATIHPITYSIFTDSPQFPESILHQPFILSKECGDMRSYVTRILTSPSVEQHKTSLEWPGFRCNQKHSKSLSKGVVQGQPVVTREQKVLRYESGNSEHEASPRNMGKSSVRKLSPCTILLTDCTMLKTVSLISDFLFHLTRISHVHSVSKIQR